MSATSEQCGGLTDKERLERINSQIYEHGQRIGDIESWLTSHDEREAAAREQLEEFGFRSTDESNRDNSSRVEQELEDLSQGECTCDGDAVERCISCRACGVINEASSVAYDGLQLIKESVPTSTIEQELEAGLVRYRRPLDGSYSCTRIYLREHEYKELMRELLREGEGIHLSLKFHDIPVYCGGPDIHYCTD